MVLLLPLCALAQLLLCPAWLCSAAPYMTVKTKEVKISGDSGSPIISFIKLLRPIQAKSLDLLNLSLQQNMFCLHHILEVERNKT